MNRALVLGIAIFFAIVGLALLGGETSALAGHCGCDCAAACHCDGGCAADCGGCHACDNGCHGRRCGGLLSRLRNRCHGCHGCHGCHAACHGCGGAVIEEAPVEEAPAEEAAEARRGVFGVRPIAFVR